MLQDVLEARPLLSMLVRRELKSRYAGSNMGAFWNLIHPIVLILIYIVIFSSVMQAKLPTGQGRLAYAIHLCSAIIPWFLFAEIISRSSTVLMDNANLLKKMALPEEVLFLSIFFCSFIVHGASMVAFILLLAAVGVEMSWTVLFAFPVMAALGVAALGMGMILSVMTLLVRDVGQIVQIILQLLFWSLPIVYPLSIITNEQIRFLLGFNPIRGYFLTTQMLFGGSEGGFGYDAYYVMVLMPFAMMVMGLAFLRSHRSEILDAL